MLIPESCQGAFSKWKIGEQASLFSSFERRAPVVHVEWNVEGNRREMDAQLKGFNGFHKERAVEYAA
jgi:hypothetical protein